MEVEGSDTDHDDVGLVGDVRETIIQKTWWKSRPRACICLLMFFLCVIPFMIATSVVVSSISDDDTNGSDSADSTWTEDFSVTSTEGVAVTDNPTCSQIAADILSEGGNAVDAAVAAALCLGVVSPASSGLGGGCFILGYNASTGEPYFIDSRETAPAAATENMFVEDPSKAQWGGLAIAVPAELRGLYYAWERSGGGVSVVGRGGDRLLIVGMLARIHVWIFDIPLPPPPLPMQ